jgi:glycosyltransferase involved in cell wall biosynthesis
MSRKKILWLCSWYPARIEPFNGDFIQRHAQAASLYNDIYVLHVYGDQSGSTGTIKEEIRGTGNLTEHIVYFPKKAGTLGKLWGAWKWFKLFRRAIRQYVNHHGIPNAVHVHVPMKAGIFALWMKSKYGVPYFVSEHWGIYNETVADPFVKRSENFRKYTRRIFQPAVRAVSPSEFLARGVDERVVKKTWTIIPNVVNTELFNYRLKPAVLAFRFIHVSNMIPLKNPEGILRAFAQLLQKSKNAELVMVGDKEPSIRLMAAKLGIEDKVRFTGEVSYENVAREMKEADCLVLFSEMENSPCVIGEALCCGLPVIATRVGGIPELVNESNGILVVPGDTENLVSAFSDILERYNRFDRESISREATAKFSYPVIGQQFDRLYDSSY